MNIKSSQKRISLVVARVLYHLKYFLKYFSEKILDKGVDVISQEDDCYGVKPLQAVTRYYCVSYFP